MQAQQSDQEQLFGSGDRGGGDFGGGSAWDAASSLNRSTQLLENSMRVIGETETIGDSVSSDLESQRAQLINAHGKVSEMRQFTGDARTILRSMGRRAIMEKCVLVGIILVLIVSIILVVYYRFLGGGEKSKKDR